jgi:hypothetical protein
MPTVDIVAIAKDYAERKALSVGIPNIDIAMAVEVWQAMAVEVLEYALPRLEGSGE